MVPQTKVFVGSLPQGSKPEELRKLFERFGVVTECDIMNRCGFVHMQTEEQASAAIRALNNTSFNGGVISVERGRIKERGQRGGPGGGGRGGGMRGGMRGGMDRRGGGPMRGGPPPRDSPYARERPSHPRGPPPGGPPQMQPRPMPYERAERPPPPAYDDRYNGYGGEDRRGFALMERGARDPYAAPAPMYAEERRYEELAPLYADERRAYDERELLERRMRPAPAMPYERPLPPRPQPMPNGDMFSRRSPMRGAAGPGGYDRDPYAQQYPPMGRRWAPG
ncbi:RNA-binding protein 4.1 isoform X2 [Helicoverpa armigera]|uniref:RNA-binding protein 4.1-like isoform X2 n=1 Tax=Helicoverpa zea TaxID=7113 RepID=UPI001F55B895|nr:RNA-binding protein 4.1-like isoform X2 [Helicoverpa zea]XP_049704826.1 RNA-binding protein 4.1 isoform X2 [Helicoverpa armigera]